MSNDDANSVTMTYDEKKQENITNMITKYNVGTLQMFIKPEVLSMTSKERKKIDSIYYKRAYSVTNNEIIKSQKEYEKELELQNKPKEPIGQQVDQTGQRNENIAPVLPVQPVPPVPALPPPAQALALPKQAPMPIVARGGAGFDSFGEFDSYNPRNNDRVQGYGTGMGTGIGTNRGLGAPSSYSKNTDGILTRVSPDAEPFIASLIKFSNSGFPNNTTVTRMVDTFFNINLFRSFIKKLGEPIKLYDKQNNVVTDMKFLSYNKTDSQPNSSSSTQKDKNEIFDVNPKNSITNWYPAQQVKTVIGSVYAFIYTRPSDLELRQQSDSGNQKSTPSMLMIKEGDNYRLIGGKIDKVRAYPQNMYPNTGQNMYPQNMDPNDSRLLPPLQRTPSSSYANTDETSESTVERQITEDYRKITAQSLPVSVSNTTRRFLYKPESDTNVLGGPIGDLKAVIYSRQVTNSQIESIIESSRASSTDVVKVPINKLYYIVKNITPGILQVKIELDEHTKNILRLLFQILEKQNLLSIISGQTRKSTSEFDMERVKTLSEKLSPSSIKELESTIQHNIQFILDILFSKKMAFKYKGVDYIIDYLEWDKKFKRLNKVLENYKVAYYIDFNLFLEKLEKGKLPTDRDGTLFSSCAVRGAQLNNYWKKNFLDRNWTNFGKKLSESVQVKSIPSISDIIPGFIKKALNVGSNGIMSSLNAGVNQISLVQYCFMGQEELIEEFKNIDNSFAGVEWKNENSWNKRKERLFAAMDNCGSDIYCFQNVQCSLDAYNTIVKSLFLSTVGEEDNENNEYKAILEDISTAKTQKQRIEKYKSVLEKLLKKVDDPLNLIAQIYQRYNGEYEFVYYFEQKYTYGDATTMVPMSKKFALGNLTMFKKSKFELINEIDIRIAPFIKTHETQIKDIPNIGLIYQNSSFATVIYCRFKEGTKIGQTFPGQVQVVSGEKKPVKEDKFPGFINGNKIASMDDNDFAKLDTIPIVNEEVENVDDVKEEEEEEEEEEDQEADQEYKGKEKKTVNFDIMGGGGDEDGGEWYNRDKSEETGFLGLFGKKDDKKPQTDTQSGTPCKKYTNIDYSPKGQIFGIINIKLETATTVQEIINKDPNIMQKKLDAEKAAPAETKATNPEAKAKAKKKAAEQKKKAAEELASLIVEQSKETKELIEVLLVAAFISNFRTIYYLTNSTDTNPYFMVGDFNFSIPSDPSSTARDSDDGIYKKAPALALLLSRSKPIYNFNNSDGVIDKYSSITKYKTKILKFIQELKIITYIHGGVGKNGRFRLFKNLLAAKFPLKDPDSATTSGLIFTTTKIRLCPSEDMAKITRDGRQEGLPLFPNKVNPSNSEAIGGVFALDTVGVKGVVEIVVKKIEDAKKEEKRVIEEADKQSIIAPLRLVSGQPYGLMDVVKSPVVKPSGTSPAASPVVKPPVGASRGTSRAASRGTSPAASPVVKPPVGASRGTSRAASRGTSPVGASPEKPPVGTSRAASRGTSPVGASPEKPTITPNVSRTDIEPPVIDIKGNDLTKLRDQTYTASDKDIIKDLSPSILTICQTGKPMYDYLTTKPMSTWDVNDPAIYSDHAPIMYNISNLSTGSGTCGPEVSTSTAASSSAGGMEGGAALENIKLITWNVGTYGISFTPKGSSKTVYSHKFIGKQTETKEQYKQRLENNITAIHKMMKDNDYQYMLLQEGPNSQVYTPLNYGVSSKIDYRNLFIRGINQEPAYTVIASSTTEQDKYGEFYLVVKNKTDGTQPNIISWGMMSLGIKNVYSDNTDNTVKTFFDSIIAQVAAKKIDNYAETDIRKDCARLWFFIDTENKQVLVSVHLSFPDKEKNPYMHQRQQQLYILLNTIVSYFRNSSGSEPAAAYKDYNIIFSGDFNINMLQPIPTSFKDRSFFECNDVAGQKTFIYTSKHNAPSSFGGQNEGKYNPTNIDFALVYPKPVAGGPVSPILPTSTSTSPGPTPVSPKALQEILFSEYDKEIEPTVIKSKNFVTFWRPSNAEDGNGFCGNWYYAPFIAYIPSFEDLLNNDSLKYGDDATLNQDAAGIRLSRISQKVNTGDEDIISSVFKPFLFFNSEHFFMYAKALYLNDFIAMYALLIIGIHTYGILDMFTPSKSGKEVVLPQNNIISTILMDVVGNTKEITNDFIGRETMPDGKYLPGYNMQSFLSMYYKKIAGADFRKATSNLKDLINLIYAAVIGESNLTSPTKYTKSDLSELKKLATTSLFVDGIVKIGNTKTHKVTIEKYKYITPPPSSPPPLPTKPSIFPGVAINTTHYTKNINVAMEKGIKFKFYSNPSLMNKFIKNKGSDLGFIFVEASPYDILWGVGLNKADFKTNIEKELYDVDSDGEVKKSPNSTLPKNNLGVILTKLHKEFIGMGDTSIESYINKIIGDKKALVRGAAPVPVPVPVPVPAAAPSKAPAAAPAHTHSHASTGATGNICPRSIKNPGNICFMNASLQLLYSINSIREYFSKSYNFPKIESLDVTSVQGNNNSDSLNKDTIQKKNLLESAIIQNLWPVLNKLIYNVNNNKIDPVEYLNNARLLAHYTGLAPKKEDGKDQEPPFPRINNAEHIQQDAPEFLTPILDALVSIQTVKDEIQYETYEIVTCEKSFNFRSPDPDMTNVETDKIISYLNNMGIAVNVTGIKNAIWRESSTRTSIIVNWLSDQNNYEYRNAPIPKIETQNILKNNDEQKKLIKKYNIVDNDKLISIIQKNNDERKMLILAINGKSIQECINNSLTAYTADAPISTISPVCDCSLTNLKKTPGIFIPDYQKYIIIQLERVIKDLATMASIKVTTSVTHNKEITIDNTKFKLKGVIYHTGAANGGHYEYIECDDKGTPTMVYSDTTCIKNVTSYDINKNGYVFLYKRVADVLSPSGGGNTIVSTLNPINKSTVKANSNKKYNKRTRKHVNKITHKLKNTINTNTNTNKTKNKKKTRKHIHKNRVIAQ
jgi:hypothetical protein